MGLHVRSLGIPGVEDLWGQCVSQSWSWRTLLDCIPSPVNILWCIKCTCSADEFWGYATANTKKSSIHLKILSRFGFLPCLDMSNSRLNISLRFHNRFTPEINFHRKCLSVYGASSPWLLNNAWFRHDGAAHNKERHEYSKENVFRIFFLKSGDVAWPEILHRLFAMELRKDQIVWKLFSDNCREKDRRKQASTGTISTIYCGQSWRTSRKYYNTLQEINSAQFSTDSAWIINSGKYTSNQKLWEELIA